MDSQFALAGPILQNMQFIGSQAAWAGLASVILQHCSQALHDHTADCNKETSLQPPADVRVTIYVEMSRVTQWIYSIYLNKGTRELDND